MPEDQWKFDISDDLHRRLDKYLQENLQGAALAAFRYQQYVEALSWSNITLIKMDIGEDVYPNAQNKHHAAQEAVEKAFANLRATCQDLGI